MQEIINLGLLMGTDQKRLRMNVCWGLSWINFEGEGEREIQKSAGLLARSGRGRGGRSETVTFGGGQEGSFDRVIGGGGWRCVVGCGINRCDQDSSLGYERFGMKATSVTTTKSECCV